jgi:hypothetical protein
MTRYEYTNAFVTRPYKTATTGVLFKSTNPTFEPDVRAYLDAPESIETLNAYGRDGWELVSVQQVLRGHEQIGNQNAQGWAYGYALARRVGAWPETSSNLTSQQAEAMFRGRRLLV